MPHLVRISFVRGSRSNFNLLFCVFTARCTNAQRGIKIACRPSVCLSVCPSVCPLSVCDAGGSGSHKLEILEINCTDTYTVARHLRSSQPRGHPPTPRERWENLGETRGGVRKSGALEHKSGNISETRKDRGKVTMESLQEATNVLSNGTIPDILRPFLPQDWGFATQPQNCNRYYLRNG